MKSEEEGIFTHQPLIVIPRGFRRTWYIRFDNRNKKDYLNELTMQEDKLERTRNQRKRKKIEERILNEV